MTIRPEQWPSVKAAFNGAVALEGAARASYLAEACGGDPIVRQHVESLLAAHEQAQSFLESPAAAVLEVVQPAEDVTGRIVGTYRVESRLGSGGMGEVYAAYDTRLDRRVALKLLSATVARDPERLRRFRVEARAASSLNHPHILVIHDFGELDARPFIITELVEGQTLRHRLDAGPIPIRQILEIVVQVASALSAAHGRGIVHRDIKPENVMLRPDGYVKVLDFGLAKLTAQEPAEVTKAFTETAAGMIMGTPHYMSPEQARGEPVDPRSDQFSFGILIYELLTRRNPFARRSLVETAAAVIADEAEPVDRLCADAPPPLRWVIERCLAKNRDDRYASTADLHRDLATVHERMAEVRPARAALPGSNLPVASTPLVGREGDVAAVIALLRRDEVHWVTLTGPGGVGKTRLSLQVAADLATDMGGAVFFVALAGISDSRLVPSAIAEELNVRAIGGESALAALKRQLGASTSPLLIVIDNFEHLADAAPSVAELLDGCPGVKILVSSRSGMHVSAEHEYHVSALRLPDQQKAGIELLAASPAVALFVQRARAARADFVLTHDNAKAVAEICTSLDGLPLAIELAAARVKVLPPQALLAHLQGKRLSLAGGARDLPTRHQTLRNTIDWGYELLAPAEQRLFRRLAVFAGGFTLEAAEAVCDARQDMGLEVFDGISSLVDKSLVQPAETGGSDVRFTMLETIREYGLERLATAGEVAESRQAHAAYCLVLAEEGDSSDATAMVKWLDLCDGEHANLRTAIDYLIDTGQAVWAMRMGSAMLPFWQARAHLAEGKDRLTRALSLTDGADVSDAIARATLSIGTLLTSMGDAAAESVLERTLTAYRRLGDRRGIAVALNAIGVCRHVMQHYPAATAPMEEALSIWRELGDEPAAARALSNLAAIALEQGDVPRAGRLYQEVRATCDRLGDAAGAAWAISFEAEVEHARGDPAAARSLYLEALRRFQAIHDTWGTGDSLLALGQIACDSGDGVESRQRLVEAHGVFDAVGDVRGMVRVIEGFARLAAGERRASRALRLAGGAAALRQKLSIPLSLTQRQGLERALDRLRQDPEAQSVGTAWLDGWAMSASEAIHLALAVPD